MINICILVVSISGACPDIFDRGGTSGALTYAGVARDGLGVKTGLDFDPHRPTRTGPVFTITASTLLMHANSVADVMLALRFEKELQL